MASACGQPRCPMAASVVCQVRPLRVRSVIGDWIAWWRATAEEDSSRSGMPTFSTTRTSDHGERLQRISREIRMGATKAPCRNPCQAHVQHVPAAPMPDRQGSSTERPGVPIFGFTGFANLSVSAME